MLREKNDDKFSAAGKEIFGERQFREMAFNYT